MINNSYRTPAEQQFHEFHLTHRSQIQSWTEASTTRLPNARYDTFTDSLSLADSLCSAHLDPREAIVLLLLLLLRAVTTTREMASER